jgi:hypothetical protein
MRLVVARLIGDSLRAALELCLTHRSDAR